MSIFVDIILHSVSRKGGTGEGGWGHPQGNMCMVAVVAGCRMPWLALGGLILTLVAQMGLENATLTL